MWRDGRSRCRGWWTWPRGGLGEGGGGRGSDGKQRREERREKATKGEIDLAFHSSFI